MKIYIIAHKKAEIPSLEDLYQPLQVGAALRPEINPAWEKDCNGENISDKNALYNELTGLYWIWKNSNEDIVGLCHYRRYFVTKLGKFNNVIAGKKERFLTQEYIKSVLAKYDLIVHNKTYFLKGNGNQYKMTQKHPQDLNILRSVLLSNYPEYIDAFDKVMSNKSCHLLNMMIGRKEIIDSYCCWLFGVLFEVEKKLRANGETSFERRMGMLGERMLDIWIQKNQIKIKEQYTINTEQRNWKTW